MVRKFCLAVAFAVSVFVGGGAAVAAPAMVNGTTVAVWDSPNPDEFAIAVVENGRLKFTFVDKKTGKVTYMYAPLSYLDKVRWQYIFLFPFDETY